MKKWLAIGIILLFVGICLFPAIAQDAKKPLPMPKGNWLYVGGSGPGNYTKIQDAIKASFNGDTVFVYDDSSPYNENVIVDKQISLIGEDKETTNIIGIGAEDIILVNANNVLITGFSINANVWDEAGVNVKSSGCIVEDNIIGSCLIGVALQPGDSAKIKNNIIGGNQKGIFIFKTKKAIISNNNIRATDSICIQMSYTGFGNTIMRNNLTNSLVGIELWGAKYSIIKENNFIENIADVGDNYYSFFVTWKNNYWGGSSKPELIWGAFVIPFPTITEIPYVRIDWHPAQKPYDITGMT
jgi:parallel beta-helix repeat protein